MVAFGTPAGELEGVAVDGKTLRGSAKQGTAQSHLLSLLAHRLGVVLRQLGVSNKSHELGAVTPLVEGLVLSGLVVRWMRCTRARIWRERLLRRAGTI